MLRLALAVDGDVGRFPHLTEIAGWLRALDVRAWVPGHTDDPPAAELIRETLAGVATAAVRHPCAPRRAAATNLRGRGLLEAHEPTRSEAMTELVATARWAQAVRASWVIVEIASVVALPANAAPVAVERERDQRLDRLCRSLHSVASQIEGIGLALALPRAPEAWLTPAALGQLFDEVGARRRIAYWHDTGRAHVWAKSGGVSAATWLDQHASRCVGLDATDAVGDYCGLPAGAGEIDLKPVIEAVGSSAWIVLRSEPFSGAGPLAAAARHLRRERA